ncbi:MAG TPA: bifunctional phosphoribosylaminoimidazolecarboxamide formyltransferase/IMP cyclohydrolase PurH [Flavobacteriales bacterium]|jgi:phosphoribosylaminoimidazolecarboxamide formyltransferase / IMP cyclohydrolase|nr:bifunctional phosphoribosylaminoimidazolecarboxamide formyltransferase/IMP cyclohydrolase [Flavobacteriales bacterium]HAW21445.1 bifunctional phosphoribosylaminoimidazolecarboxamide formyltransferase/IMP cyclohydrolase PurH [Flavobacteriales bacterium]
MKEIRSALVSVFNKDGLDQIAELLQEKGVKVYSTGGTAAFFQNKKIAVTEVESITNYPSILGGRVKTLHPKVFGGILARNSEESDREELEQFNIPTFDLVVVDLYPFSETVKSGASESDIIEKIDIGGISLIRAAAKNFNDVVIIPSKDQYQDLTDLLKNGAKSTIEQRRALSTKAFGITNEYDGAISDYFSGVVSNKKTLRYGENPHQQGAFIGDIDQFLEQLHGKELSYNNLLDVDSAIRLIRDFKDEDPTFAVIKHNNACGFATRANAKTAYLDALAGDPVSAFGGIIASNCTIDLDAAEEINKLFCEVVMAPAFTDEALALLKSKKNRMLLIDKQAAFPNKTVRSVLNGVLEQDIDSKLVEATELQNVTKRVATAAEVEDLLFANKLVKHTKSNTIVLAKNKQLVASGVGQTSRVDALRQAIDKAKSFGFDVNGCVMSSDAFFPFPDCVEIANGEGVKAVIQPGGSVRDQESVDYCNAHNMAMVITGTRHFRH